jgi:hypothetical protein
VVLRHERPLCTPGTRPRAGAGRLLIVTRNVVMWLINGLKWRANALGRRAARVLSDCLPDRIVLARRFRRTFGRPLNLKSPTTFNEKLFWLMLYYRTPLVTRLADKYAVRQYVAERVGPGILNDLYAVWERVDDIDFTTLPEAFVLKVTWGANMNIFCRKISGLNVETTKEQLRAWMSRNSTYWDFREWSYKNIKPRIICERLLVDRTWGAPPDYKFYCFAGEPRFVQVGTGRFTTQLSVDGFGLDWQPLPFTCDPFSRGRAVPRPSNLDELVAVARRLSHGFPFVRVDLYAVDGRALFGEMTWYPYGGEVRFSPDVYDTYWGAQLRLPA